jgi:hypothetical protein
MFGNQGQERIEVFMQKIGCDSRCEDDRIAFIMHTSLDGRGLEARFRSKSGST